MLHVHTNVRNSRMPTHKAATHRRMAVKENERVWTDHRRSRNLSRLMGGRGRGAKTRCWPQDFERSLRLLERTLDGATLQQCGAEFGLHHSSVSQLVAGIAEALMSSERLRGERPPLHNHSLASARRRHPEFWRRQIARARLPATRASLEALDTSPLVKRALEESVTLCNHYAELLNRRDGALRRTYTVESWLAMLERLQRAGART